MCGILRVRLLSGVSLFAVVVVMACRCCRIALWDGSSVCVVVW